MTAVGDLRRALSSAVTVEARIVAAGSAGGSERLMAEAAAEGLLLNAYTAAEHFVREFFFELIDGISLSSLFPSPLSGLDADLNRSLVYLATDKLDWMPPGSTVEPRANVLFPGGHPFLRLRWRSSFARRLNDAKIVRDRISHSGEKAESAYWSKVAEFQQAYKRPGAWLISRSTEFSAPTSNLKVMINTLESMAVALSENSPDLDILLGQSDSVGEGTKTIPGTFNCSTCSSAGSPAVGTPLGRCRSSICVHSQDKTVWKYFAV
ncbi:hypothetical protein RQN9TF_33705 (plasmid) [Rhodococcus qingshengii]|jgi:hypothetical protein|uniref:hypothetical protein n=1 Tax=Rhodococcus TaxID=1827 RepID=UPI000F6217DC|nr:MULTISPECIES: hypothetical protein [Rhodococcus]AZI65385.1 hypothetical protein EHW12_30125 [Rhodococcus sp. NJ-530]BDQ24222.1 hypothetical protein RQN9TF_33705 [Rhodococcus qingshengii]